MGSWVNSENRETGSQTSGISEWEESVPTDSGRGGTAVGTQMMCFGSRVCSCCEFGFGWVKGKRYDVQDQG